MGIDRSKNTTIIMNKEDVKNPLYPDLWAGWLEMLGVDPYATEVALCKQEHKVGSYGVSIVVYKDDIKNPSHINLWKSWLETLNIPQNQEALWLCLSPLDENKKVG